MNFQDIFQAVEVQSISAKNGNLNPLEVYATGCIGRSRKVQRPNI
jgi:hypothetical protein